MSERPMTDERERLEDKNRISEPGEESLTRALDTLEDMLDPQHGQGSETPPAADGGQNSDGSERPRTDTERSSPLLDGQCTIPLLDDVVLPGAQAPSSDAADGDYPEAPLLSIADDKDCERLVQRLTSELEVIIQTGVEEALRAASKRISRQVKDHIDIMLPEILEEIARMKDRHT